MEPILDLQDLCVDVDTGEPTTALDVTVQAQIFRLLRALQAETETAIMLITYGLGAVAEMADDVAVLYAGKTVETGRSATSSTGRRTPIGKV